MALVSVSPFLSMSSEERINFYPLRRSIRSGRWRRRWGAGSGSGGGVPTGSGDGVLDLAVAAATTTFWRFDYGITIAVGIFICLAVCVLIWPVWASQELHQLTVRNMEKLPATVEGCVDDYFAEAGKGVALAKSEGYKCVLNSKASEDSQANLARWEPAHVESEE